MATICGNRQIRNDGSLTMCGLHILVPHHLFGLAPRVFHPPDLAGGRCLINEIDKLPISRRPNTIDTRDSSVVCGIEQLGGHPILHFEHNLVTVSKEGTRAITINDQVS